MERSRARIDLFERGGLDKDVMVLAGEREFPSKCLGKELKVGQDDLACRDRDETEEKRKEGRTPIKQSVRKTEEDENREGEKNERVIELV